MERFVREELKRDIFFNTTVGTWASPFWFHYTDAVWRQEGDYGTAGDNKIDRETGLPIVTVLFIKLCKEQSYLSYQHLDDTRIYSYLTWCCKQEYGL